MATARSILVLAVASGIVFLLAGLCEGSSLPRLLDDDFSGTMLNHFRWVVTEGRYCMEGGMLKLMPKGWRQTVGLSLRHHYILSGLPFEVEVRLVFPGRHYRAFGFTILADNYRIFYTATTSNLYSDCDRLAVMVFNEATSQWVVVADCLSRTEVLPTDTNITMLLRIEPSRVVFNCSYSGRSFTRSVNFNASVLINKPLTLIISAGDIYSSTDGINVDKVIIRGTASLAINIIWPVPEAFYIENLPLTLFTTGFRNAQQVTLFYQYSSDGLTWSNWRNGGTDSNSRDGWSWNFNPSEGVGYYRILAYSGTSMPPEREDIVRENFEQSTGLPAGWQAHSDNISVTNVGGNNVLRLYSSGGDIDAVIAAVSRGVSLTGHIIRLVCRYWTDTFPGSTGWNPPHSGISLLIGKSPTDKRNLAANMVIFDLGFCGTYTMQRNTWHTIEYEYNTITETLTVYINRVRALSILDRATARIQAVVFLLYGSSGKTVYIDNVVIKDITRHDPMLILGYRKIAPVARVSMPLIAVNPVEIAPAIIHILPLDNVNLFERVNNQWVLRDNLRDEPWIFNYYFGNAIPEIAVIPVDVYNNRPALENGVRFVVFDRRLSVPVREPTITPLTVNIPSGENENKYYSNIVLQYLRFEGYNPVADNIGFGAPDWNSDFGKVAYALYLLVRDNWRIVWQQYRENIEPNFSEARTVNWYMELANICSSMLGAWRAARNQYALWRDAKFVDYPFDLPLAGVSSYVSQALDAATVRLAQAIHHLRAIANIGPYAPQPSVAQRIRDNLTSLQQALTEIRTRIADNINAWLARGKSHWEAGRARLKALETGLETAADADIPLLDNKFLYDVYLKALFLLNELGDPEKVVIGLPQENVLNKYAQFIRGYIVPASAYFAAKEYGTYANAFLTGADRVLTRVGGELTRDLSVVVDRIQNPPYAENYMQLLMSAEAYLTAGQNSLQSGVSAANNYYNNARRLWGTYYSRIQRIISERKQQRLNAFEQAALAMAEQYLRMAESYAIRAGIYGATS